MLGQLLLNYQVVEKIGEGGQGTVYKVIDTTLDRPAVIKVLPPDLTDSPSNLARFEREAKLASSLDHPNICTIFGLHKAGDTQFIAMQYIEGRNVRQLVDGKPLDLRRALSIAIQVTDALAAAHARGIVHRDIKARNVMVTRTGTVKVLDFGLAKLIDGPHSKESSDPQLTEVGVPYGTSTYAAPEQAQGLRADHRAFSFTIYSDYIRSLYYAGRLEEAKTEASKMLEMDPDFGRAHYELGLILEEEGKPEDAIAAFRLALKSLPDNVAALTALGHAQALAGKRAEAEKTIARLQELSKQQYVSPYPDCSDLCRTRRA